MGRYSRHNLGTVLRTNKCEPCGLQDIVGQNNCHNQFGPEWADDGQTACGDCKLCKTVFGKKVCALPGALRKCRKTVYTADKNRCCLGMEPRGWPNSTCSPKYEPSNPLCNQVMRDYCRFTDRIFTDQRCRDWAAKNPQDDFDFKNAYCTPRRIHTDKRCRAWVRDEADGRIDNKMVREYCPFYPSDPLCSCITSEIDCPNKFDSNCIQQGGYITSDMRDTPCPDILTCNQFVALSPESQAIAVNVEQDCNFDETAPLSQPPPPTADTELNFPEITADVAAPFPLWAILLIVFIIAAIIIGVAIGVGIYFWRRKKKSAD